jgi:hypothetical protein
MEEQEWAARFGRDLDRIFARAELTSSEPLPAEYRESLDLARLLARADFSTENQKDSLLRQLLGDHAAAREQLLRGTGATLPLFEPRRLAAIEGLFLLVAFFFTMMVWTEGRVTFFQAVRIAESLPDWVAIPLTPTPSPQVTSSVHATGDHYLHPTEEGDSPCRQ